MIKNTILILVVSSILLFGVLNLSSCKELEAPKGVVSVVDTAGNPVVAARVRVFAKNGGQVYVDGSSAPIPELIAYTDINGVVRFNFKYAGILSVEVSKSYEIIVGEFDPYLKYTWSGTGVLILEEDKTANESVILYHYTAN